MILVEIGFAQLLLAGLPVQHSSACSTSVVLVLVSVMVLVLILVSVMVLVLVLVLVNGQRSWSWSFTSRWSAYYVSIPFAALRWSWSWSTGNGLGLGHSLLAGLPTEQSSTCSTWCSLHLLGEDDQHPIDQDHLDGCAHCEWRLRVRVNGSHLIELACRTKRISVPGNLSL